MAKQGRCPNCKVNYRWEQDHPMDKTACPQCSTKLARTTHGHHGPWIPLDRIPQGGGPRHGGR